MGYPKQPLATRAVVKHGSYAVIPPEGLVNNVVPGIEGCRISIVASPKMGASFVMYVVDAQPGGGTTRPFAAEPGVESFVYIIDGEGVLAAGQTEHAAAAGAYLYAPTGVGLTFHNTGKAGMKAILYKQRYLEAPGTPLPEIYCGNTGAMDFREYDNMHNVFIKDLLPTDFSFDMNFHILSFAPGGCHPFVETHVQEHGAYILEGQGCYLLDNEWRMIGQGDFVWFGPYVTQGAYGVGQTNFTYIYSKDCNRDAVL